LRVTYEGHLPIKEGVHGMPMHMGIPPPGIPTLHESADREGESWDEMMNAMINEHIEQYTERGEEGKHG
jgi:hypothetical protein